MAKATSYGEVAIGLAFAAGGVGICVHASGLRDMPGSMAGPGLFPSLTGAGMMLFGVMLVASALLKARRSGPGGGGTSAAPADATASLALSGYSLAILAGVIALSATLPSLGFPAAATVFTAVVCRLGGASWRGGAIFGLALTAILYVAFVHGLGVQLPRGVLKG